MNLEEKYRLIFFNYLYNLIDLKKYENYLEEHGIEYITNENIMCPEEIVCRKYSKYFYLLNVVDINNLTFREIDILKKINIDDINNDNVKQFLEKTYKRVLFTDEGEIYYGPMMNDDFKAKSTDIALGIKYDELGFTKGVLKDMDVVDTQSDEVRKIINEIENNCKEYPIRIIQYNEIYEALNGDDFIFKKM